MIKLIGRRAGLFLLASVLLGAIFGSFHNSATMAQHGGGPEEPVFYEGSGGGGGGGSTVSCVTIPSGCASMGCNGNPGHYTCALYVNQQGATCTSGGACAVH